MLVRSFLCNVKPSLIFFLQVTSHWGQIRDRWDSQVFIIVHIVGLSLHIRCGLVPKMADRWPTGPTSCGFILMLIPLFTWWDKCALISPLRPTLPLANYELIFFWLFLYNKCNARKGCLHMRCLFYIQLLSFCVCPDILVILIKTGGTVKWTDCTKIKKTLPLGVWLQKKLDGRKMHLIT